MLLFDFSTWWSEKDTFEQIYWLFAFPSTLAFLIIMVSTFMGGDFDDTGDVDTDIETDDGPGFQFFTLKNLVGFFTIFSWIGLACIEMGMGVVATLITSFLCGLAMMFVMAGIFYFMSRLTDDGTLKLQNAIGRIGEVYLPVQAKRGAMGQVNVTIQGGMRTLQALTDDDMDLPVGTVIKVTEVINNQILLVTKNTL